MIRLGVDSRTRPVRRVLRRAGMARSFRAGSTVAHTLAASDVAQLLLSGRRILASMWAGYEGLLADFCESVGPK